MVLSISTERQSTFLRQLSNEADDLAYFNAIDGNRDHLSQFGDETAANYPTLEAVTEARVHASNPDKLRFGIWDKSLFVGSINLTPDDFHGAEIGYWLDQRYTGNGYATLAAKALGKYGRKRYEVVYAHVAEGNMGSEAVLERAGFERLARGAGKSVFTLAGITRPDTIKATPNQAASVPVPQDLERFAELPSRREALRAKDKDNLMVFLSFGLAKKLYRCPCCNGRINIGDSHAILSRVQMSSRYTHHHIDFTCVQEKVLPTLTEITVIDPEKASASAVNARRRKYRNKKRK